MRYVPTTLKVVYTIVTTKLSELANRYDAALQARTVLKKTGRISSIFKRLDRVDQSITDLSLRLEPAKRELATANRSRSRCQQSYVRGARSSRIKPSTRAFDAWEDLDTRLDAARAERKQLERRLKEDTEWNAASDEFYEARHELLVALAQRDVSSPEHRGRKLMYMLLAGVDCDPDVVWSDATSLFPWLVNLYYGGDKEPDGPGHGHVTLMKEESTYLVTYHRAPVQEV